MQILGAGVFALAAVHAVLAGGGEGAVGGGVHFFPAQFGVLQGENLRNGDTGGAAVHTVAAGGAGNFVLGLIEGADLMDDLLLLTAQRLEICHIGKVILQLLHARLFRLLSRL